MADYLGSQWENDPQLIEAWSLEVDDRGDWWRRVLVNPLIAELLQRQKSPGSRTPTAAEILAVLNDFRTTIPTINREERESSALAEQLDALLPSGDCTSSVLDLGCGEGWLGRWLASTGCRYLGVDVSTPLLELARQKAHRLEFQNLTFERANLDDKRGLEKLSAALSSWDRLDLATALVALEHLERPGDCLELVSHRLSASRSGVDVTPPVLLAVCLNPAFFEAEGVDAYAIASGGPVLAEIRSIGKTVNCYLRSHRDLLRLFRDSRLVVKATVPLHFPRHSLVDGSATGLAPFVAYLLEAGLRGAKVTAEQLNSWFDKLPLFRLLDSSQKADLCAQVDQLEMLAVDPGEAIVTRHNLGGDLFIILDGSAELKAPGGLRLLQGETLGELEASPGEGSRVNTYIYSVTAGQEGADVLRIPADLALKVLGTPRTSVASYLFWQTRDRMSLRVWQGGSAVDDEGRPLIRSRWEHKGVPKEYTSFFRGVPRGLLRSAARLLLASADAERLSRYERSPDGLSILTRLSKLRTLQHVDTNHLLRAVRVLAALRVVDLLEGKALLGSRPSKPGSIDWGRESRGAWSQVVAAAAHHYLSARAPSGDGKALRIAAGLSAPGLVAFTGSHGFCQLATNDGSWTKDCRETRDALLMLLSPSATSAIDAFFAFLYRVNCLWRGSDFIVLQDEPFLRRLVVSTEGEVERELEERWLWLSSEGPDSFHVLSFKQLLSDVLSSAEPGRLAIYLARRTEFVLKDLKAEAQLRQSSGEEYIAAPGW